MHHAAIYRNGIVVGITMTTHKPTNIFWQGWAFMIIWTSIYISARDYKNTSPVDNHTVPRSRNKSVI